MFVFTKQKKHIKWVVFFILFLVLEGCAVKVKLVGEYDAIMDKSVHQIEVKTITHIEEVIKSKGLLAGSYEQNQQFYFDIKGEIQALIVRATALEDGLIRTPLTENFNELLLQYDDLEKLHKGSFNKKMFVSAKTAMERSFKAIIKHLVYMKWNQEQPE
ncbi:MAG: hypothetical protein ACEPO8_12010 [Rhodothermaceae bacterium]